MGKRKPSRRIRDRERQLQLQAIRPTSVKSHKVFLELLGGIATLLTIVAFYLSYIVPKLSIDVSGSLRPSDPMGNVLQLSNDGVLPIHDITAACKPDMDMNAGRGGISGITFTLPDSFADILSPGHKMTLPCAHALSITGAPADTKVQLLIRVWYRPDWLWWHKYAEFPLEAERTADGKWLWKQHPK